ncbi:MAG: glycosyltransferase family 9 protein [Candidatus Binataceae bacterium]
MPLNGADLREPHPARVLIVLLGSIGDVVRALPLLGRMRAAWPAAHLAWAVEPKSEPILRGHPWINELIVYERRRAPWSFAPLLWKIRHGRFDLVVDLQRHLKSGIISRISGARDRLGFAAANVKECNQWFSTQRIEPQPPMRLKLAQYQAFGDLLGIAPSAIRFGLEPSAAAQGRGREIIGEAPRPLLGVILGSSWPSRVYFAESIAATIRALATPREDAAALFPILIGAPEDAELAATVTRELGATAALNLVGKTSLSELPAIFAECAAAFGPDSGPMHIAAAVGCPIVSLWGATAPERSAPWGFAEFTVRGEIPCSPCYLRRCPIGRECMRRIAPDAVAATVRRAVHVPRERNLIAKLDESPQPS